MLPKLRVTSPISGTIISKLFLVYHNHTTTYGIPHYTILNTILLIKDDCMMSRKQSYQIDCTNFETISNPQHGKKNIIIKPISFKLRAEAENSQAHVI